MICTIYNKNTPILRVEYDEHINAIFSVVEILNIDYCPIGLADVHGVVNKKLVNTWWRGRSIPASRDQLSNVLHELNIHHTEQLVFKAYGLSLSDQYWICPDALDLSWDSINFFTNEFTDDLGDLLLHSRTDSKNIDLFTPNNTSDGWLRKKWTIIDGERWLIKAGSTLRPQEPYNEVFASSIHKMLGREHVPYSLITDNGEAYSACPNMIDENTEIVPAWQVLNYAKKDNNTSVYQHFVSICLKNGLSSIENDLQYMLATDYLIRNTDRHLNNFGVIRNVNTLEWIKFAPIFDSGTSMWVSDSGIDFVDKQHYEAKPFHKDCLKQMGLVNRELWHELFNNRNDEIIQLSESVYNNLVPGLELIKKGVLDAFSHRMNHIIMPLVSP